MGSKFTPGPWIASRDGKQVACDRSGGCSGYAVATVFGLTPTSESQRQANARLIAAAPDLLDALKDAVCALEVCGRDFDHVTGKAKYAIAKATGESL